MFNLEEMSRARAILPLEPNTIDTMCIEKTPPEVTTYVFNAILNIDDDDFPTNIKYLATARQFVRDKIAQTVNAGDRLINYFIVKNMVEEKVFDLIANYNPERSIPPPSPERTILRRSSSSPPLIQFVPPNIPDYV